MDVVNIGRSQRFLRERPIRVNLFDRPRVVLDLLCLEPGQEESRRGLDASDSVVLLMEGKGRIDIHAAIEELEEMDAVLVPPGVDHRITNTGEGRLVAVVMVTPKPTRASEVRVPGQRWPGRSFPRSGATSQPGNGEPSDEARENRRPPRSEPAAGRRAREGGSEEGPNWYPKSKPAWRPRGAPPASRGGRPQGGPRGAGPRSYESRGRDRRDEGESTGSPPRRDARPQGGYGGRSARPQGGPGGAGPRSYESRGRDRRDEGESTGSPPRRDARPQGGYGGRGGRPQGGPGGAGPRSYESRGRDRRDEGESTGSPPRRNARPQGGFGSRGGSGGGGFRPAGPGRSGGSDRPRGAAGRGRENTKKTGDARRASRGQGPLSGRRGPGRSGPRT